MTEKQSIDSSLPGFVMPDDWHGRKVDASNRDDTFVDAFRGVRLIGWNAFGGPGYRPFCITDDYRCVWWADCIKFTDSPAAHPVTPANPADKADRV